jgi:hypothetical protein
MTHTTVSRVTKSCCWMKYGASYYFYCTCPLLVFSFSLEKTTRQKICCCLSLTEICCMSKLHAHLLFLDWAQEFSHLGEGVVNNVWLGKKGF